MTPKPLPQENTWLAVGVTALLASLVAVGFVIFAPPSPCANGCLGVDDARELFPADDIILNLGFDPEVGYEGWADRDFNAYDVYSRKDWRSGDGSPAECEFTQALGPAGANDATESELDDPVVDFGGWRTDNDELWQTIRVLDSDADATALIAGIDDAVPNCTAYRVKNGITDWYEPEVRATQFETADGVESAAWVQTTADYTATFVTLRHKNLVTRVGINRHIDSSVTDEQFAGFVAATSTRLIELGK